MVSRLIERGTIEIAPLAYMRGRTLNDSFIILDEAQNTTPEQMKMFLTRLGFGSRIVVTGDVTQVDLPEGRGRSGLLAVARHPRRRRGSRVRGTRRARCRAPQDRPGHRQRVRTRRHAVSVFASDEQSMIDVDLPRWLRLARLVLAEERAPADAEVSLNLRR